MKKIIVTLLCSCMIVNARAEEGYQIDGYIGGIREGQKIIMALVDPSPEDIGRTYDSCFAQNGEFHLKGVVRNGPRYYFLVLDMSKKIRLLINNEKITIRAPDVYRIQHSMIDQLIDIQGESVKGFNIVLHFVPYFAETIRQQNHYLQKIGDSVGFDKSLIGGVIAAKNIFYESFYWSTVRGADPDVKIALPWFFRRAYGDINHAAILMNAYNDLDEEQKNSYYGKLLKEDADLSIGQKFPPVILKTQDENDLALKDIVLKNKVTVIQFWSEVLEHNFELQYELKRLYKKYENSGFDVIGIYLGKSPVLWKEIIKRYELPWHQVSDLKGAEGVANNVFHLYKDGDPRTTNVVLDSQGRILAWNVDGVELQWYLAQHLNKQFLKEN